MWKLSIGVPSRNRNLGVLGLLVATVALGATNNCPQTTGSQSSTTVPGTGSATTNLDNSLDSINNYTGTGTPGCTAINLQFNNFAIASTGGTATTLLNTYMFEAPTGTAYDPKVTPTTLTFSSMRGTGSGSEGGLTDNVNNFRTLNGNSLTRDIAYVINGLGAGVYAIVLTVNNTTIDNNASGSFQLDLCVGGTQTGVHTTGSCAGGGTFLQSSLFNLAANSGTQTFTYALPAAQSGAIYIDLTTHIILQSGSSSHDIIFVDFGEQFIETPEPSSFILLGTALVGLGFLRYRHRDC